MNLSVFCCSSLPRNQETDEAAALSHALERAIEMKR